MNSQTKILLSELRQNPPVSVEEIERAQTTLGHEFPNDYVEFLRFCNGGEGFIGETYVIFWRAREVPEFNTLYEVTTYAPGLLLFGSNGGGEAYAFDTRLPSMATVQVPFVGMDLQETISIAPSFNRFLVELSQKKTLDSKSVFAGEAPYQGRELFEIKPVKLGGSPIDRSNKTLLSREQHISAVNYWNKVISELKGKR